MHYDVVLLQPALLQALATVLADVGRSAVSRAAAGLQLKNYLTSKNPDTKRQYVMRWLQIDTEVRNNIKQLALVTLGTESSHPSSAAQVLYECIRSIINNIKLCRSV